MKVRTEEMLRMAKETSLNKILVSYLEMCVYSGQIYRGFNTLNYYRARSKAYSQLPKVKDIAAYNILLHGFAAKVKKRENSFIIYINYFFVTGSHF
jgi:hypothetical protein